MKKRQGAWQGIAALALVMLTLGGCATTETIEEAPPVEDKSAAATTSADVRGTALPEPSPKADLLGKRRVHFAFDSSSIDSEARAIIEAHAAHLVANPGIKFKLEGHCDERGTREYNLALGERRAQAVERMMKVLGVAASRIQVTSYGEEKPLDAEHNESAWRLNRRVEILY